MPQRPTPRTLAPQKIPMPQSAAEAGTAAQRRVACAPSRRAYRRRHGAGMCGMRGAARGGWKLRKVAAAIASPRAQTDPTARSCGGPCRETQPRAARRRVLERVLDWSNGPGFPLKSPGSN